MDLKKLITNTLIFLSLFGTLNVESVRKTNKRGKDFSLILQTEAVNERLVSPLAYRITSSFGETRIERTQGGGRFSYVHKGIDLAPRNWKYFPLPPIFPGEVGKVGYDPDGYGKHVIIESNLFGQDIEVLYAHLQKIYVRKGKKVGLQDIIGIIGNTGKSKGYHLHLETKINGILRDPLEVVRQIKALERTSKILAQTLENMASNYEELDKTNSSFSLEQVEVVPPYY